MKEVFELKGPAGRIVVRREVVAGKLKQGYEFCDVADKVRFENPKKPDPVAVPVESNVEDVFVDDEDESDED